MLSLIYENLLMGMLGSSASGDDPAHRALVTRQASRAYPIWVGGSST